MRILVAQNEEGHRELRPALAKHANEQSQAPKQKQCPFIQTPSPPDLGHTSPLTWSLDYLGVTVKTLS